MNRTLLLNAVTALLILLFVYTAGSKLLGLDVFENQLRRSPLIGSFSGFFSVMIPLIELMVAVLLLIPQTLKIGLYCSLALLVSFTAYLIYMLSIDIHLPCTCGGVISQMSWQQHVVFNLAFIVLNLTVLWIYPKQAARDYQLSTE